MHKMNIKIKYISYITYISLVYVGSYSLIFIDSDVSPRVVNRAYSQVTAHRKMLSVMERNWLSLPGWLSIFFSAQFEMEGEAARTASGEPLWKNSN